MIRSESSPTPEPGHPVLDYLPAALLLFGGLLALSASWLLSGPQSGQYLVITAPTSTLPQSIDLITRGGGRIAATSGFSNVVIAGAPSTEFTASLRRSGAWLAVPVPALAGCGIFTSQEQTQ